MGVTIHYKGTINNLNNVDDLCAEIIDIAETMGWEWTRLDEDLSKPCTAVSHLDGKTINITGHLPLKGVTFHPHKSCEYVELLFDAEGRLNNPYGLMLTRDGQIHERNRYLSVKTQFAPIDIHITIIKLFRHLKKRYIPDLKVYDDGGYWETDDVEELARRRDSITQAMDILEGELSKLEIPKGRRQTPEEIANAIEEVFKKRLRSRKKRKHKGN